MKVSQFSTVIPFFIYNVTYLSLACDQNIANFQKKVGRSVNLPTMST
jgi:hypothetical protein